YQLRTIPVAA
ncbi:L-aspartate oxidase, partial [Vibrio parahaemolyticus V-223/04]